MWTQCPPCPGVKREGLIPGLKVQSCAFDLHCGTLIEAKHLKTLTSLGNDLNADTVEAHWEQLLYLFKMLKITWFIFHCLKKKYDFLAQCKFKCRSASDLKGPFKWCWLYLTCCPMMSPCMPACAPRVSDISYVYILTTAFEHLWCSV